MAILIACLLSERLVHLLLLKWLHAPLQKRLIGLIPAEHPFRMGGELTLDAPLSLLVGHGYLLEDVWGLHKKHTDQHLSVELAVDVTKITASA
jgi:hypothetical protein